MARKTRKNIETAAETASAAPVYSVAAYIRLSVEDNHKRGDSVDTQRDIIQNYLALNPELRLHDYYTDNGATGQNFERKAFQRMLADAEKGVINCIIVKDLSRFGRNTIDTGYYIEKYLPSLKVRFIAITDDFDSSVVNPGDGIMLPLKNMINEAYALDIGKKIKAQQRQAMNAGEFVGARPPYGYVKASDNCHKLIIDPEASEIVKLIFQWAYEKAGINTITRRLNEAGIEPPNIYSQRKGIINFRNLRSNNSWQTFAVSRILTEEAYMGDLVQGKTRTVSHKQTPTPPEEWITVHNTHEPLVSREVFAAVQEFRKRVAEETAARPVKAYTPNIFKGKIFCGHCGMSLHRQKGWKRKGAKERMFVFHCLANSRKARGSCETFTMPEDELTAVLLAIIQKHAAAVVGESMKLRENQAAMETKRAAAKYELAAARQETGKDARMLKSLYESLVNGVITADEYREMRAGYEKSIAERLARAAELERGQSKLEAQVTEYLELSGLMKKAADSADITAALVDRLIDRIRVFSDRRVEVDFRFESGFERLRELTATEIEVAANE